MGHNAERRLANYAIDRALKIKGTYDPILARQLKWYQFIAKREKARRTEELRSSVTYNDVYNGLMGDGMEIRGQSNLAWSVLGWGGSAEIKFDVAQFFAPGSPFTAEVGLNVKHTRSKQVMVMTQVMRNPVSGKYIEDWGKAYPAHATPYFLMLACMKGTRSETELSIGVEAGVKASKVAGIAQMECIGFNLEAKATATANAGGAWHSYQGCDYAPRYYGWGPDGKGIRIEKNTDAIKKDPSIRNLLKEDLRQFLTSDKDREAEYYYRKGHIVGGEKRHLQPFNPLCSVVYHFKKGVWSVGIGAEGSVTVGAAKGSGVGLKAAVGVGAKRESQATSATFRIQIGDPTGIVMTQDTVVLYSQITWSLGAKASITAGVTKAKPSEENEGEYEGAEMQQGLGKEFSKDVELSASNQMSYRSAVTYWKYETQEGLDYHEDREKYSIGGKVKKNPPMYNALFPKEVLPGTGVQIGLSASVPTLKDYCEFLEAAAPGLSELNDEVYEKAGGEEKKVWITTLAHALRVRVPELERFCLKFFESDLVKALVENPDQCPGAFLIEANFGNAEVETNFEAFATTHRPLLPGVKDAERSTYAVHQMRPNKTGQKSKRMRALKNDLIETYIAALLDAPALAPSTRHGQYVREVIEPATERNPPLKNLQCIRLRYRLGDKEEGDETAFKLGIKAGPIDLGAAVERTDRAGSESIVDIYTQWFGRYDGRIADRATGHDAGESDLLWPVPRAMLIY